MLKPFIKIIFDIKKHQPQTHPKAKSRSFWSSRCCFAWAPGPEQLIVMPLMEGGHLCGKWEFPLGFQSARESNQNWPKQVKHHTKKSPWSGTYLITCFSCCLVDWQWPTKKKHGALWGTWPLPCSICIGMRGQIAWGRRLEWKIATIALGFGFVGLEGQKPFDVLGFLKVFIFLEKNVSLAFRKGFLGMIHFVLKLGIWRSPDYQGLFCRLLGEFWGVFMRRRPLFASCWPFCWCQ